jgi:hypothetical protein
VSSWWSLYPSSAWSWVRRPFAIRAEGAASTPGLHWED